jgi:hypothetical protein
VDVNHIPRSSSAFAVQKKDGEKMELDKAPSIRKDFNAEVASAIGATLSEILGERVLVLLYKWLKDHYDIGSDEIPHRLPTVIQVLEEMFGAVGARAIGPDVAKRLYSQLGLSFVERSNWTLENYIEEALRSLSEL